MRTALAWLLLLASARAAADPLVLPSGQLEAALTAEVNLSTRAIGEPISLAPDIWYGVDDRLTLGVVHSAGALSQLEVGGGVCVGGAAHGCEQAYSESGVDGRWSIVAGEWSAAARVRVVVRRWSPILPSVRLGALARWQRGRVSITADPYLQLGLAHIDQGNRNQIQLPVWLAIAPGARWSVYLHTGVGGEIAVFSDAWAVPIALGARVSITPRVDLAAEGGFVRALGPLDDGKLRMAWISVSYRP